ncbi:MAG: antitoxin Xre/MbcA/ParS toxin-binding domain-containing protein [Flavobacteriaceae bacterium]
MKKKAPKPYKSSKKTGFAANEPTVYYVANTPTPLNVLTSFEKMQIIKRGISKRYLESFKEATSLDYASLADALLVTRATLINKKGDQKFNNQVSERIVSIADLYAFGYEVFEDKTRFNEWMFVPNQGLGGEVPFSIVNNQYGREEIKNLIGRIAYGVYS